MVFGISNRIEKCEVHMRTAGKLNVVFLDQIQQPLAGDVAQDVVVAHRLLIALTQIKR